MAVAENLQYNKQLDQRRSGDRQGGLLIAEMWEAHHEIARRILLGQKNVDIARDLGCTPATVSNVRNSPVVKDKLAIMSAVRDAGTIELAKEIQDLAPLALSRIREALEQGTVMGKELNSSAILKEANNLLDRDQGKATQRIDTRNLNATLTVEDIELLKEKAKILAGTL